MLPVMTLNILIVEDDSSFKRILEVRLKSFLKDPNFTHCPTLQDARKLFSSGEVHFDLVVLDQNLPDGKGLALLQEGLFRNTAVLAVSSDDDPQMPGQNVLAGAAYFLGKAHVSEPLFKPLVQGIIDRNRLQKELNDARVQGAVIETVKTLVSTLQHEINNPLGAVLGGAFLMKSLPAATPEQKEAAELVETSGKRIKHVMDQLLDAITLEPVSKANHKVFHIPGDEPWEG